MTQPPPDPPPLELTYAAPSRKISRLRQTTWIILLTTGCLTVCMALCLGGWMLAMVVPRPAAHGAWFWFRFVIFTATPLATGIAEMIAGFKVRKRSTSGLIVGFLAVFLQLAGTLYVILGSLIRNPRILYRLEGLIGLGFYALAALLFIALLFLLFKLHQESRRDRPTGL